MLNPNVFLVKPATRVLKNSHRNSTRSTFNVVQMIINNIGGGSDFDIQTKCAQLVVAVLVFGLMFAPGPLYDCFRPHVVLSARADGAVSLATVQRARGVYGPRVLQVKNYIGEAKEALENHDWIKLSQLTNQKDSKRMRSPGPLSESVAPIQLLYSSVSAYEKAKAAPLEDILRKYLNAMEDLRIAIRKENSDAGFSALNRLESSYKNFLQEAKLEPSVFDKDDRGLTYGSDFHYNRNNPEVEAKGPTNDVTMRGNLYGLDGSARAKFGM